MHKDLINVLLSLLSKFIFLLIGNEKDYLFQVNYTHLFLKLYIYGYFLSNFRISIHEQKCPSALGHLRF